ncbi:MAG: hypothetical protein K6G43_05185 [Lachnospiraceae bacterium]|nr:hypothetical protein [Lachnospiraceae bacterium]
MTSPESQNKGPEKDVNMSVNENNMNANAGIKVSGISLISLLKEDLRHRRWMLVLSSVVQGFAGPVVVLFMLSALSRARNYGFDISEDALYTKRAIGNLVENIIDDYMPIMQIVIAVVGALIVGLGGFRHLFNRRMTDMVNSLPVKREKQFVVTYLNGLLIWLVPFICSVLISYSIVAARTYVWGYAGIVAESGLYLFLGTLLCFVVIYNLVVLGVVLAGTVFNSLLNIGFIGFDLIIGYGVLYYLCESYYDNFLRFAFEFESLLWLSPPIAACTCGYLLCAGRDMIGDLIGNGTFVFTLVMTILTAVVNFVLSMFIYLKRKSEEAESGVSNKPYRFLMRTVNAIFAGHIATFVVTEMFSIYRGSFNGWRLFFGAFFTVLIYGIIDMFHGRSFKAFFAHWKQMIAVVIVMEAILVVFMYDLTGYDNRMVAESNINGAVVNYGSRHRNSYFSDYVPVPGKEGYLFSGWYLGYNSSSDGDFTIGPELAYDIISANKMYSGTGYTYEYDPVNRQTVRTWNYSDQPWDEEPFSEYLRIDVDRKVGPDFYRGYRIADRSIIERIISLDEFMEKNYQLETGAFGYPESMSVSIGNGYDNTVEIPDWYIPLIMEAYYADFAENYSIDYLSAPSESITLNLRYRIYYSQDDYEHDNYSTNRFTIYPLETDTRTMQVLEKLVAEGYIDPFLWLGMKEGIDFSEWVDYYGDYYYDDYYYYD